MENDVMKKYTFNSDEFDEQSTERLLDVLNKNRHIMVGGEDEFNSIPETVVIPTENQSDIDTFEKELSQITPNESAISVHSINTNTGQSENEKPEPILPSNEGDKTPLADNDKGGLTEEEFKEFTELNSKPYKSLSMKEKDRVASLALKRESVEHGSSESHEAENVQTEQNSTETENTEESKETNKDKSSDNESTKPTESDDNSLELSKEEMDMLESILPNTDDVRNELNPSLNIDRTGLSTEMMLALFSIESGLASSYASNRKEINEIYKNPKRIQDIRDRVKSDLIHNPTPNIEQYKKVLEQYKSKEKEIESEKEKIKSEYDTKLNEFIEKETERLREEYRKENPDYSEEKIAEMLEEYKPQLENLKMEMERNKKLAEQEVMFKFLDDDTSDDVVSSVISFIQLKQDYYKNFESIVETMNKEKEKEEKEKQNLIQSQNQSQSQNTQTEVDSNESVQPQTDVENQDVEQTEHVTSSVPSTTDEDIKEFNESIEQSEEPTDEQVEQAREQSQEILKNEQFENFVPEEDDSLDDDDNETFSQMMSQFYDDLDDDDDLINIDEDVNDLDEDVEGYNTEEIEKFNSEQEPEPESEPESEPEPEQEQEPEKVPIVAPIVSDDSDEMVDEITSDENDIWGEVNDEGLTDEQLLSFGNNKSSNNDSIENAVKDEEMFIDNSEPSSIQDESYDELIDDTPMTKKERKRAERLEKQRQKEQEKADKIKAKRDKKLGKSKNKKQNDKPNNNVESDSDAKKSIIGIIIVGLVSLLFLGGIAFGGYWAYENFIKADEDAPPSTEEFKQDDADNKNADENTEAENAENENADENTENENTESENADEKSDENASENTDKVVKSPAKVKERYKLSVTGSDGKSYIVEHEVVEVNDDGSAVMESLETGEQVTIPYESLVQYEEQEKEKKKDE